MKILGVIPARYNSQRFPAKALADINGKPMIQCVYEQVAKCESLSHVVVATDDERIATVLKDADIPFVMTSVDHKSGTERCIEVVSLFNRKYSAVINIQGDEPFINPLQIEEVADLLLTGAEVASQMCKISSLEKLFDENTVKVIADEHSKAMYFSRQALPFQRGVELDGWLKNMDYYQHIGIYGYRIDALDRIKSMKESELEKAESLEQLRWLANGMSIKMGITKYESHGIDTPEDLKQALEKLKGE